LYFSRRKPAYHIFAYWHDPRWNGFVGASVKIKDLAHNLATMGNDVVIFLPKNNFRKEKFVHEIIEIPFINLPFLRLVTFNIFLFLFLIIQLFKKSPSVVYVRRMNSVIPALYAKLRRAVLIYEVNDDPYGNNIGISLNYVPFLRSIISSKQDQINLRLCDKAFVITHEILEKVYKYNPYLKKDKLKILPSGANTDLLKPLDKVQCRTHLKFNKGKKIVGFAGTLLGHQGIEILIQAAPQIIKKIPETIFLIIGEGPKKLDWIDLVKRQGLSQHFIFAGQISYENIPIWLGATDICVAPFMNSAGFRSPVKIFDYMACGKAVVASKIKGTTDIFSNSSAILLVEPEEPEILANAILKILNDDEKSKEMGHKGRKLISEKYDRKIIAEKISTTARYILSKDRH